MDSILLKMILPQDNIIDLFLCDPNPNTFDLIDNKGLALKLLSQTRSSSSKDYFYWLRDKNRAGKNVRSLVSIIFSAIEEGNTALFFTLIETLMDKKYELFHIDFVFKAAEYGRREKIEYFLNNGFDCNDIAISASWGGHSDIVYDMIKGFKNKDGVILRADSYGEMAQDAVFNNDMELYYFLYNKGISDYDLSNILCNAAEVGNKKSCH